jgi:hypothetical protein
LNIAQESIQYAKSAERLPHFFSENNSRNRFGPQTLLPFEVRERACGLAYLESECGGRL